MFKSWRWSVVGMLLAADFAHAQPDEIATTPLPAAPETMALLWLGMVFLGLLLWVGLTICRRRTCALTLSAAARQQLQERRRQLFAQIVQLDERFAHGELPVVTYRAKRSDCQHLLRDVTILCHH